MSGLIYLTDEKMKEIGLAEEERQTVAHYKRVLGKREILPMVHPTEKDDAGLPLLVSTIIPPRTTKIVEDIIEAVRNVAGKILQANSNWCQCARQYMLLENGKAEWIKKWIDGEVDPETGRPVSKTRLEKKIEEVDRMIRHIWGDEIPPQWAVTAHDPPCQHCGKPRLIDQMMAYSEPGFVRNLLNVFLGGEFPLEATSLFLEYLDRTIFNEDVIPPAKKKRVMAVEKKVNIIALKDKFLAWVAKKLMMLEEEEQAMHKKRLAVLTKPPETRATVTPEMLEKAMAEYLQPLREQTKKLEALIQGKDTSSPPNTSADSTNITEENGDGPQMKLTETFHPVKETSTTNKTLNSEEK